MKFRPKNNYLGLNFLKTNTDMNKEFFEMLEIFSLELVEKFDLVILIEYNNQLLIIDNIDNDNINCLDAINDNQVILKITEIDYKKIKFCFD